MTISNTIDDLTDTFFGLHAMLAIIRHDMIFIASTTFNTCVWACILDETPVVEVVARLCACTDAWVI